MGELHPQVASESEATYSETEHQVKAETITTWVWDSK
jgi:hypothetical protein